MRISEPAVQATSAATPYEAQFEQLGGEATDRTIILSLSECREVATIDRMYTNGERDLAKEAATAASIVRACNAHQELVASLRRAEKWIASEMHYKGWSQERIENPPEGSHLHDIRAALAKATAIE